MPELPEVAALVDLLATHAVGETVAGVDVASVHVLKTYAPPVSALAGLPVTAASRHGKFLDLEVGGLHLVVHLARAGWLVWRERMPATRVKPGRGPIAFRVRLDDGSGFDLTEAGTQKRLAVYLVSDPAAVPGVARLGPDPLDPAFTVEALRQALAGRSGLKALLRDQSVLAGIGNAYSDEILHAARLSPFKPAANLTGEEVQRLYAAMREVLADAVSRAQGQAASDLKADKKLALRVHGRSGQPCPVCGDTIRSVSFADSSLEYCPTCQTGGRPLADRRLSRLLK